MNDPFAMLDPVKKPAATAASPGVGGFGSAPMQTYTYNGNAASGFQAAANPFGSPVGGMTMPQQYPQQQNAMYSNSANFMTQQGPPAFSSLGPAYQQHATYNPQQQSMPQMQQQMQYQSHMGYNQAPPPPPSVGGEPIMYNSIKNLLQPSDPFATSPSGSGAIRTPEPVSAPSQQQRQHHHQRANSTVVDFDPFSPRDATPRTPFDFPDQQAANTTSNATGSGSGALADRLASSGAKRPTQEQQRSQLQFSSEGFAQNSTAPPKISLKSVSTTQSDDNAPYFLEGDDAFMSGTFANLDDDFHEQMAGDNGARRRSSEHPEAYNASRHETEGVNVPDECGPNEYDVRFEHGRKLGVLMERVDMYNDQHHRIETAVVKLVVENGAADRVGVSIGSSVVAINRRSVGNESYVAVLDMIKAAPRPLHMRFQRGTVSKDTTQGTVLTRISNGTFSVGNLTSGNAVWGSRYFAFGGAKMDVLQLFISRAAYHECVIALYEKRGVHTQIQSFRLCRDHKISPIKSKIYKGYGQLHYFSLTVPSLRFVAAKFASDEYDVIKNLWSNTYDAIERKKRAY